VKISKGEDRMDQKVNTTTRSNQDCLVPEGHSSIATDVVASTRRLAQRARQIAESANEKLYPVMATDTPPLADKGYIRTDHYPPLFLDIQDQIFAIDNALDSIEYSIERTTL
jgi:hypothetical protein